MVYISEYPKLTYTVKKDAMNAPRVTPTDVQDAIAKVEYLYHNVLTVCVITMKNGFLVTGESACASPENYNRALGEKYAYERAFNKAWDYEGYLLRQALYERNPEPATLNPVHDEDRVA